MSEKISLHWNGESNLLNTFIDQLKKDKKEIVYREGLECPTKECTCHRVITIAPVSDIE